MNTDLMKLSHVRWQWYVPGYDGTVRYADRVLYFPHRDLFGRETRRSFDTRLQRTLARVTIRDLIEEAGEVSKCQ